MDQMEPNCDKAIAQSSSCARSAASTLARSSLQSAQGCPQFPAIPSEDTPSSTNY